MWVIDTQFNLQSNEGGGGGMQSIKMFKLHIFPAIFSLHIMYIGTTGHLAWMSYNLLFQNNKGNNNLDYIRLFMFPISNSDQIPTINSTYPNKFIFPIFLKMFVIGKHLYFHLVMHTPIFNFGTTCHFIQVLSYILKKLQHCLLVVRRGIGVTCN